MADAAERRRAALDASPPLPLPVFGADVLENRRLINERRVARARRCVAEDEADVRLAERAELSFTRAGVAEEQRAAAASAADLDPARADLAREEAHWARRLLGPTKAADRLARRLGDRGRRAGNPDDPAAGPPGDPAPTVADPPDPNAGAEIA